ncbi:hypothetical protein HLB23_10340 [Nocardia uniformis]|uniref:DUF8176 domain-containing protein n=1 Tax=Nocardia uniformis TaxID=53432 RepID=A0A849C379_9NOCA|nr:hypothetical protein [Nocardia uniformis]
MNAAAASASDFGPPLAEPEFGPPLSDFGPPQSEFGPPLSEFGPPLSEFGPPVTEFGQPIAPSPEMGWRPADAAPPIPAPPQQYRAPDSSTPQYPRTGDASDATVRFSGEQAVPPTPPSNSGWAPAGGIKTSQTGRESTWLRSADAGMPSNSEVPQPPAAKSAGAESAAPKQQSLSWADDPIAQLLAPKPAAPPVRVEPTRSRARIVIGGGAVLAALIALVVVIVMVNRGGSSDDQAGVLPSTTNAAGPTSSAALSCPARMDGNTTVGNGPGSTATGSGAILGFQHAFYADRSGTKARSFVAPDAPNVSPAETIQQAINDVIPVGTTYCLRIVEVTPEVFDADLTEHRPDGSTTVYHQRVTTVNREGKHLIFEIAER